MSAPCCSEQHLPGVECNPQPAHRPLIVSTLDGHGVHVSCAAPRCVFIVRTAGVTNPDAAAGLFQLGHAA